MTLVQSAIQPNSAPGVIETGAVDQLSEIGRQDCAAAIWQRHMSPCFQRWIDALDAGCLPRARVILKPEDVHEAATRICDKAGMPDCPQRSMLIDDTTALAETFAELMQADFLRLRYDPVNTDACRRFHVDTVTARLICTYRGPGTEYGLAGDGDAPPARVFNLPTGAPILLRGKLWPESPNVGLRHRSPPIEGTGQTRLVLVLDPIADPNAHSEPKFIP